MNLQDFLTNREKQNKLKPAYRTLCSICSQPQFSCYCKEVHKFDCKINFVILIHPIEVKRRIATGRMSHLCLQDSHLIKGQDYTNNSHVDQLIADPEFQSIILYPGLNSKNISNFTTADKAESFSADKKLRVFVIDGTWATARKMIRQSQNLKNLPRFCFSPTTPSRFRVRKQPHAGCYSTIEAIHHTIELLGEAKGFSVIGRKHDQLLSVFDYMVEKQLEFIRASNLTLRESSYRREGQKKIA